MFAPKLQSQNVGQLAFIMSPLENSLKKKSFSGLFHHGFKFLAEPEDCSARVNSCPDTNLALLNTQVFRPVRILPA